VKEKVNYRIKNSGFYFFTNDYVYYELDTTVGRNILDIKMLILNPISLTGSNPDPSTYWSNLHHQYIYRNIYVFPQYNSQLEANSFSDTLLYNVHQMILLKLILNIYIYL
jgi:hypothetical protein